MDSPATQLFSFPSLQTSTDPPANNIPFNLPLSPPEENFANDTKLYATPFSLEYTAAQQVRSLQYWHTDSLHVATIAQMTMKHLEAFIVDQFQHTFAVSLKHFGSTHMDQSVDALSLAIAYAVDIVVDGATSDFTPSLDELDLLIELAFMEPPVLSLVQELHALPSQSPFHATESIVYVLMPKLLSEDHNGTVLTEVHVGPLLSSATLSVLAGGSFLILVLASCALLRNASGMRNKNPRTATDCGMLNNEVAKEREMVMPLHSNCETLSPQNYSTVYCNPSVNPAVLGNCTTGSPTVSSTESQGYGQMSVASMASETQTMFANQSFHGYHNASPCWASEDAWSRVPSTRRRLSSTFTVDDELSSAELNFDPPPLHRFPVDPPASYHSLKLDIHTV